MFERIVARLVERAMPPDIEDPAQGRIAQDAAENGIRQTARVAGIAGGIVCVLIAAALFIYFVSFPRQRISPGPSEATSAAPQARAEANAMLRQAIEDLQKRLDIYIPLLRISPEPSEATSAAPQARAEDRAKLRQTIEDLQKQLDEVTKERDTFQGKVAALERQAAKVLAPRKDTPPPTRPATGPAKTPVLKRPPSTYQCGDGRTVQDPAECKPAASGGEGYPASGVANGT